MQIRPGDAAPGREERFQEFLRSRRDSLYTLFARAGGDVDAARDLLQETCIDAWRSLHRYDPSRPFGAWIWRIARDRLHSFLRRRSLERRSVRPLDGDLEAPGDSPSDEAISRERQAALESAIAGLPEPQRIAVLLRYQEDLSCAEIGKALGTTANAVSILLHRARKALRARLEGRLQGNLP
jgi:RNA polymerase sigma-70 factor (ECF subfamily)